MIENIYIYRLYVKSLDSSVVCFVTLTSESLRESILNHQLEKLFNHFEKQNYDEFNPKKLIMIPWIEFNTFHRINPIINLDQNPTHQTIQDLEIFNALTQDPRYLSNWPINLIKDFQILNPSKTFSQHLTTPNNHHHFKISKPSTESPSPSPSKLVSDFLKPYHHNLDFKSTWIQSLEFQTNQIKINQRSELDSIFKTSHSLLQHFWKSQTSFIIVSPEELHSIKSNHHLFNQLDVSQFTFFFLLSFFYPSIFLSI